MTPFSIERKAYSEQRTTWSLSILVSISEFEHKTGSAFLRKGRIALQHGHQTLDSSEEQSHCFSNSTSGLFYISNFTRSSS